MTQPRTGCHYVQVIEELAAPFVDDVLRAQASAVMAIVDDLDVDNLDLWLDDLRTSLNAALVAHVEERAYAEILSEMRATLADERFWADLRRRVDAQAAPEVRADAILTVLFEWLARSPSAAG